MTTIAEVIDWKFNSQSGMCCKEDETGIIRIVEFPGGIPTQEEQDIWVAEYEAFVAGGGLKEQEVDRQFQLTNIQKLIFLIEFDQENRIRVLEGKLPISAQIYLNASVDRYKAL